MTRPRLRLIQGNANASEYDIQLRADLLMARYRLSDPHICNDR